MALLLLLLLLPSPRPAPPADEWKIAFRETFSGSRRPNDWHFQGEAWRVADSSLTVSTREYDRIAAGPFWVHADPPYAVSATLRGTRAGIFFGLEEGTSKALSHMVRFEGKTILTGYFTAAAEFIATGSFEAARAPVDWTTLRVQVNPREGAYTVSVDGTVVGRDTLLRYPSGFAGLQASDGTSSFRDFTILLPRDRAPLPPPRPGEKPAFAHVREVRADGVNLEIMNPESRRAQTIDRKGRLIRERESDGVEFRNAAVTAGRYRIENRRLLRAAGGRVDTVRDRLVSPSGLAADGDDAVFVADPGANAVFRVEGLAVTREYRARLIGGFTAPRGVALYGTDRLAVADYDRIVLVPRTLEEPAPQILPLPDNSARITWPGTGNPAQARYAADTAPQSWRSVQARVRPESTSVLLRGLSPRTRYSLKISPVLETVPPEKGTSGILRFATPPSTAGNRLLTRLPVLCMVYRTVSYEDRYPADRHPTIPRGRTMNDAEIQSLRDACAFNAAFYFRNSGCRVVLDFDFHVVEATLRLGEIGETDPYWLEPNARVTADFEQAARRAGRDPSAYAGLVVPYAWVNHPPRRTSALRDTTRGDTITIRQAYGGGTYGVPAPWKYGSTSGYTGNPFQDRFSRQDWLITHEFHHQVDALMEASGFADYYHADQPWKMPGRFGEDFDFNAAIIRSAPAFGWEALRFGTLAETRDADMDGLPDDDPTLPADERRLGADPSRRDTDGDGSTDLQEYMAGGSRGTRPDRADTDGDGTADGLDEAPLYRFPTVWKQGTPHSEHVLFGDSLQGTVTTSWSDTALMLRVATAVPVNLLFQIDAENDGWFHGFDNYQLRVHARDSAARVQEYYLRDCASRNDPPKDRKDILSADAVTVTREVTHAMDDSEVFTLGVMLPPDPAHGLELRPGKRLAIRVGVQTEDDRWVWQELFERNHMLSIELR